MTIFAQIYIDEDVDILVATLLKVRSLDATTTREQKKLGNSDANQLDFSTSIGCCILTHNRLDFERLHKTYESMNKTHSGILVAKRRNSYEIAERVALLFDGITVDEITNQLIYL